MNKTWRPALLILAGLVVALPAAAEPAARSMPTAAPPVSAFMPHGAFGPRQHVFFGYVRSLTRNDARYVARIDPSLILTGITASTAAVEDKALRPGEPVPNDYYERNESKRPLTYRVLANAHVTVLVNPGAGPRSAVVSVSEFSRIVTGENPRNRPGLWGPGSGFWTDPGGRSARVRPGVQALTAVRARSSASWIGPLGRERPLGLLVEPRYRRSTIETSR